MNLPAASADAFHEFIGKIFETIEYTRENWEE